MALATAMDSTSRGPRAGKVELYAYWIKPQSRPSHEWVDRLIISLNVPGSPAQYTAKIPKMKDCLSAQPLSFSGDTGTYMTLSMSPGRLEKMAINVVSRAKRFKLDQKAQEQFGKQFTQTETTETTGPVQFITREVPSAGRFFCLVLTCDDHLKVTAALEKESFSMPVPPRTKPKNVTEEGKESEPGTKKPRSDADAVTWHVTCALGLAAAKHVNQFRSAYKSGDPLKPRADDFNNWVGGDPVREAAQKIGAEQLGALMVEVRKLESGSPSPRTAHQIDKLCIQAVGKETLTKYMAVRLQNTFQEPSKLSEETLKSIATAAEDFSKLYQELTA